jgi:tetratricopeptide (TPR) repeat protein
MSEDLKAKAITAALSCDWSSAIQLNTELLKENPADLDALNRLGRAYLELGENVKAITFFKKALKIDKYNPIAQRNLARAAQSKGGKKTDSAKVAVNFPTARVAADFLEEPGRTKLVALVNVAPTAVLLEQKQADQVLLVPKRHTVIAMDAHENYLGALPDDLGHRLSLLIKGGNHYCALTKSVSKNGIVLFLREISRAKRFADTPSFITSGADYFSFIRDEGTEAESETTEAGDETTGGKFSDAEDGTDQ